MTEIWTLQQVDLTHRSRVVQRRETFLSWVSEIFGLSIAVNTLLLWFFGVPDATLSQIWQFAVKWQ